VDVRLIAATNKVPEEAVKGGHLREDLFYRLNVFHIHLPPLRERKEDLPSIAEALVSDLNRKHDCKVTDISAPVMEALLAHNWPGNIRELRNVLERSVILTAGRRLYIPRDAFEFGFEGASAAAVAPLADAERRHILEALRATAGVIGGPKGAAALLGLKRSTLQSRMAKLGITRSARGPD